MLEEIKKNKNCWFRNYSKKKENIFHYLFKTFIHIGLLLIYSLLVIAFLIALALQKKKSHNEIVLNINVTREKERERERN